MSITRFRSTTQKKWTYQALNAYQERVRDRVLAGGHGEVILSEVEPVITLGRRPDPQNLPRDLPVLATGRGGLATYHGPGQWILFAVNRLENLTGRKKGVRDLVRLYLKVAQKVANEFGQDVEVQECGQVGVWTKKGKLASIGLQIDRGVALHGMSLNVFPTPESFRGLQPCGLDVVPDFLSDNINQELFQRVASRLERHWRDG